jgi:hypothetical protein
MLAELVDIEQNNKVTSMWKRKFPKGKNYVA